MKDWKKIQKYYDEGHTWREVTKNFGVSMCTLNHYSKNGIFKSRNRSESQKLANEKFHRRHTEETKNKISKARIKFLKENPDKVPYLLNHSSKESYAEKYFNNILNKTNFKYERYCSVNRYQLDFAFVDKGIDLEIDGDQHYLDEVVMKSDERRNIYLKNEGWEIIRIKWSDYQKLNREQKKDFIKNLIDYLNNKITLPILPKINSKSNYSLCECGNKKWHDSKQCKECSSKKSRKFNVTKNELKELLKTYSYEALGRKFGVCGKSIKKRAKKYEII